MKRKDYEILCDVKRELFYIESCFYRPTDDQSIQEGHFIFGKLVKTVEEWIDEVENRHAEEVVEDFKALS